MNEPIRTQWQIRCAFNGFCKQALKREAIDLLRNKIYTRKIVLKFLGSITC